jgi:hypothetical protein
MAEDLIERSRREGARRRALHHGLPLPEELAAPQEPRASAVGGLEGLGVPWALPVRSAEAGPPPPPGDAAVSSAHAPSAPSDAAGVDGKWFDRRAFAFGWLAMIVALFVFQSALLTSVAGLVGAYVIARRRKLLNAVVAVGGAYVGATVLGIALVMVALLFGR